MPEALAGKVVSVQHPSLTPWASQQMAGFGGCFALELSSEQAAQALPGALRLFRSATSLGGVAPWLHLICIYIYGNIIYIYMCVYV